MVKLNTRLLLCLKRDKTAAHDSIAINIKRIHYASGIAGIVHIVHIALFALSSWDGDTRIHWQQSIILSHICLFVFMSTVFFVSRQLRRTGKSDKGAQALLYVTIAVVMAAGVIITAIDQLVTTNITPFTIVCLVTGTVFLIRPAHSLVIFAASFAIFCLLITQTPVSSEIVLSNCVNGLTSLALGFALSIILWRNNVMSIKQQKRIDAQQQQLECANRELEKMAYYDSLTGLPNRRFFDGTIAKETSMMKQEGYSSCLILIDIDHFKKVNDAHGHPTGDSILIEFGRLLKKHLSIYDTVCRLGGEEFLILLPQTKLEEAIATAERLRAFVESNDFCVCGQRLRITASFGVSKLCAGDGLINQYTDVDNAVYLAKQSGRNCVKVA